jgi:cytochrome c5
MNRFIGFTEWQEMAASAMSDDDLCADCALCDGEGTEVSGVTCKVCGGSGCFYSPTSGDHTHPSLSRKAYEKAVTQDLKKACTFAKWDFLDMAGIFAKECRGMQL